MKTMIRIAPADAALVIRANGTIETWLPHSRGDPAPNATAASALTCAYCDERIMTMILDALADGGDAQPGPAPGPPPRERSQMQ